MTGPQLSQEQAIQALVSHIAERLHRGETAEAVRADLFAQGLSAEVVDQLLAGFAPSKWRRGLRGWTLRIFGVAVMLAGAFLWLGNRNGYFPTFSFAGTIVVLIGAAIFVVGGGKK